MPSKDLHFHADILHTIFCGRQHEQMMEDYDTTDKCTYYLEQSLDRTWEQAEHLEWIKQANFLKQISQPFGIKEVLHDMVRIYNIAEQFRRVNPRLLDYLKILIT